MRCLTSARLTSTLPPSGERQARDWATSGDWEPDSPVAEALRLHQIERDLIVQGVPDYQTRSDRLLEAQSRHDYALFTLQQAWTVTETASEEPPQPEMATGPDASKEASELAAFDMQLASLDDLECSALKELVESERTHALSSFEQMEQFQREAGDVSLWDVREVIDGVVTVVEDHYEEIAAGAHKLGHATVSPPRPGDFSLEELADMGPLTCVLSKLQQRRVVEKRFSLFTLTSLTFRPSGFTKRDSRETLVSMENYRRGKVCFRNLNKKQSGWTENQLALLDVHTPAQYRQAVWQRKQQIFKSLSDGYLAVRVAVLRNWQQILMEAEGQDPWRLHWPESRDDDRIMTDFLTIMSMRYTTWAAVNACKMHVIEFHRAFLAVCPPPFPMADWMLAKLKKTMAQEKPEGRRMRPGLDDKSVSAVCGAIRDRLEMCVHSKEQRALYVNMGAAIGVTFEQALRMGETCPGDHFDPQHYWSRQSILAAIQSEEAKEKYGVSVFILQPMKRKTSASSDVARERCNLPFVFDGVSTAAYALARWGPLLEQYDPCPAAERKHAPAFRKGGAGSAALSSDDMSAILKEVGKVVLPNWKDFHYGLHSLRIGRENAMRATNASPELLNLMLTHTATAGRAPYSRVEVTERLNLHRAAAGIVVQPVETLVQFQSDRSANDSPVYMTEEADGSLQLVEGVLNLNGLVISDEEDAAEAAADFDIPPLPQQRASPIKKLKSGVARPVGRAKAGCVWDSDQGAWVECAEAPPPKGLVWSSAAQRWIKPAPVIPPVPACFQVQTRSV
jgi:hypothetical protein